MQIYRKSLYHTEAKFYRHGFYSFLGRDEPKENLRAAIAVGVKALSGLEIDNVDIDAENSCSQSIAEAVAMTTWAYKADKREKFPQHFSHINGGK